MADMKNRLIELINNYPCMSTVEDCFLESISDDLAGYLLANSVIVPPCKVEDTVYELFMYPYPPFIQESIIEKIIVTPKGLKVKLSRNKMYETAVSSIGKTIFLTREEAEKALKELENNG